MRRKRLEILVARLMPAGVLGVSMALAPAAQATAAVGAPSPGQPAQADVAARLSSIRDAVTAAVATDGPEDLQGPLLRRVWWGNHGWGRPWRWGGGGWRNGGWGNGGGGNWHPWGNGGWGNWHPWGNL